MFQKRERYIFQSKGVNMVKKDSTLYFKNLKEFRNFIKKRSIYSGLFLGRGREGCCYESPIDHLAYKVLDDSFDEEMSSSSISTLSKIITAKDFFSEHFLFPHTLFATDEKLLGYTSRAISNNLFARIKINNEDWISQIDFDMLLKAYDVMIREIERLSKEHIEIFDLGANLMFDGKQFYGIDTVEYRTVDKNPLKENLESLKIALIHVFNIWENEFIKSDEMVKMDIEEYLKGIQEKHADKIKVMKY